MKNLQKKLTAWLLMFSLVFCMTPVNVWASDVDFSETTTEAVSESIADSTPDGTETTSDVETSADDENTTVDDSIVDDSTVDDSTVDDSIVDEPTVDDSTVDDSIVDEPTVDDSIVDDSTVDDSTVDEPTVDEPIVDEPIVDEPIVDEPIVDEPIVDEPAVDETPVVDETATLEPKPELQPEQKPDVILPPMNISTMEPPVQATLPQPEVVAPVVPAEIKAFLQAVDELTAGWNDLQAKMESGLDFSAEMEALNSLGVAAMDAYEAVQAADLESFDGVENALFQLMSVTEEMGYAAEMLKASWHIITLVPASTNSYSSKITSAKVRVGQKVNGYEVTSVSGTTIKVKAWGDLYGDFFLPKAADLWNGAVKSDYVIWAGTGASNKVEGASALLPQSNASAYYYFNTPASVGIGASNYVWDFTLKYNANGGTGAPADQTYGTTNKYEKSHTFTISEEKPSRDGYIFKGWAESSTATSANYQPNSAYRMAQTASGYTGGSVTKTLYAVWEKAKVQLTYIDRGVQYAQDTYEKGANVTIKDCTNTNNGYKFLGWDTDKSADEVVYQAGDVIIIQEDTTLYAVWEENGPNKNFNLIKVFEGLDKIPDDFSLDYTVVAGSNSATRTFNKSNAVVDDENMTLTWQAPYFYDMGSDNKITIVERGDVEGYTYNTTVSSGTVDGNTINFNVAKMASGVTRTITNTYTELNSKYEVIYTWTGLPENVEVELPATNSYTKDTKVTVDVNYKADDELRIDNQTYVFSGWSTEDVEIDDGTFIMPEKNVIIKGTWIAKQYNVVYNWTGLPDGHNETLPAGGSYAEGNEVNVDNKYTNTTETKIGETIYVFSGWSTEDASINDGKFAMPGQNVTIIGTWQEKNVPPPLVKNYDVEYKWSGLPDEHNEILPTGGSYAKGDEVNVNTSYTDKTEIKINDTIYAFSGWSTNDAVINDGKFTMPGQNVTIIGTWTKIETYTVIYTDGVDDEEVFADQTTSGLKYGVITPAFNGTPIREGYEFTGWSPVVSEIVTGNAIYVAQWKKIDTIPEKPPVNPDPEKPAEKPTEPSEPSNPTGPTEPGTPGNPTVPVNPSTPDDGGSGDDSGSDDNTGDDDNTGTTEPAPAPVATIDEQATPLTEAPVEDIIFDEEVPLAEMPDEEEETLLDDTDVPLANVPKTGDNLLLWFFAAAISGIASLVLGRKRG